MTLTVPLSNRATKVLELKPETPAASLDTTPEGAREAAVAALARGETHYTDRPGILPLRKKVSDLLNARFNLGADPNTIVITCAETEARFVSLQCLLKAGDALLCMEDVEGLGAALIVRDAGLRKTSESLEGIKVLYVTSHLATAQRDVLLQQAKDNNWWVIFEVKGDDTFHPSQDPALRDKVVTIGAIGKSQGLDSWRVGYLHAPKGEAPELRSFKQALTICTTSLSQYAALAFMEAL